MSPGRSALTREDAVFESRPRDAEVDARTRVDLAPRGGAARKRGGLITRRSRVRVPAPQRETCGSVTSDGRRVCTTGESSATSSCSSPCSSHSRLCSSCG